MTAKTTRRGHAAMTAGQAFAFKRLDSKSDVLWHAARVEKVVEEDGETRIYFTAIAWNEGECDRFYQSYVSYVPDAVSYKRWQLPPTEQDKYSYEFRGYRDGDRVQPGPPAVTISPVADSITDDEMRVWEAALRIDFLGEQRGIPLRLQSADRVKDILVGSDWETSMTVRTRTSEFLRPLFAALRFEDGQSRVTDPDLHIETMAGLAPQWHGTMVELVEMAVSI